MRFLIGLLLFAAPISAQTLPSGPIVLADGVAIGGTASVTVGPEDPGFFNYADYDRSVLRLLQLAVSGSARAGQHVTFLGQVRTQNVHEAEVVALYVRVRPWATRPVSIHVGRIPPTFGAFSRRVYSRDNPLIGYPLAYQYLTSLRPDALPATADELLTMRGRGWLSSFTVGNQIPAHGMPLVSALRWDTGVQVQAVGTRVEATAALTGGTVSDPRWRAPDGLRQFVARIAARPNAGLVIGTSFARGPYVTGTARAALPETVTPDSLTQTAWGADVEYSRDYYLLRAEVVATRWQVPALGLPAIDASLTAFSTSLEGRYKLRPDLFAAARLDTLRFSQITGSTRRAAWDAPVTRVEIGGGYLFQRNLQLKLSYQHNTRDTTRLGTADVGAMQLVFWFGQ